MALAELKEQSPKLYTVEEYLKIDRESEERYEYLDGEIFLRTNESLRHGDISVNLISEISFALKRKSCRVWATTRKTRSDDFPVLVGKSKKGLFSYPDLIVICGEPKFQDNFKDIVLNPKIVIEILSETTELFDRTDKFFRYRMFNDTLTDYILVSQNKPQVEHYVRDENNSWKLVTYFGLDETLFIESIKCSVKLSEIYDRVKFTRKELALIKLLKK